jgi:hypothetical protein
LHGPISRRSGFTNHRSHAARIAFHPLHFTISPFHHFTISPFHHPAQ